MEYQPPLEDAGPGGAYLDANPETGFEGSRFGGKALEHPQRELVHLIEFAGLTPSADLTQVRQAIQFLIAFSIAIPAGRLVPIAYSTPDGGFLLCDGAEVSRTTYAALFAKIGTTYGIGNGSTTFNVPDLRGRMPLGSGSAIGLTPRALGAQGGEEAVVLGVAQMPTHSHGGATATDGQHNHGGTTASDGQHTHSLSPYMGCNNGIVMPIQNGAELSAAGIGPTPSIDGGGHAHSIASDGGHTHAISPEGGGQAHNNMPPFLAINWQIKT